MNVTFTGSFGNGNYATFVAFYTEVRKQITNGLIFSVHTVDSFDELTQLGLAVDFINIHSYDLHFDSTSFSAPIFGFFTSVFTFVDFYTSLVAPDKINLGIPMFGVCMVLSDPAKNVLGSPTLEGKNFDLPYSQVSMRQITL